MGLNGTREAALTLRAPGVYPRCMNKHLTFSCFASVFLLTVCSLGGFAAADEAPAKASKYTPGEKLHRGINNTATGWLEAPVTVDKFNRERNLFEAVTTGATRGVGLAIARTGVGIYEIFSSPFAAPERYEPLMMPEKVEG
jgi:putative exosortase-associated protein (TIGR04073 family)